jgi:hypothetical protein
MGARMNGLFEWLLKLLFIALLAPFFVCLFIQLLVGAAVVLLPWVIALAVIIGLAGGIGAGLVLRRRLPLKVDKFPRGDVPRIRRPRGIRTER